MEDCSTADIERLLPKINALALAMAQLQERCTDDLDLRDKVIVLNAAFNLIHRSSRVATRKMSSNRFLGSISRAMHLARIFGTGTLKGAL